MKQSSFHALAYILLGITLSGFCDARKPPPAGPAKPVGRFVLVSSHAVILIGNAALPLFKQCSRGGPEQVTGYWTPSVGDVQQIERDAPAYFKAQKREKPGMMVRDYRQYAGFIQHGRRMIYMNAFPAAEAAEFSKEKSQSWHSVAVVICDGGPSIYGVEYDLKTRLFQNLEFNGVG